MKCTLLVSLLIGSLACSRKPIEEPAAVQPAIPALPATPAAPVFSVRALVDSLVGTYTGFRYSFRWSNFQPTPAFYDSIQGYSLPVTRVNDSTLAVAGEVLSYVKNFHWDSTHYHFVKDEGRSYKDLSARPGLDSIFYRDVSNGQGGGFGWIFSARR
ncbi:hypothetical protein [Flaviaesturariibacter terrae]